MCFLNLKKEKGNKADPWQESLIRTEVPEGSPQKVHKILADGWTGIIIYLTEVSLVEKEKDSLCNFPLCTALILSDLDDSKNNLIFQNDLGRIKQRQWQGQFVLLLQVWQHKKHQPNSYFYFLHISKSQTISK